VKGGESWVVALKGCSPVDRFSVGDTDGQLTTTGAGFYRPKGFL